MGSSLWLITVIRKGKKWIDLEVQLTHPNAGDFPEDPAFALQLLTSEAYSFGHDFSPQRIAKAPLGEAIEFNNSYLPGRLKPRLSEFIEKVVVYETHNVPFDAFAIIDDQVLAKGIERGSADWEDTWNDSWNNLWSNKELVPWAIYRIFVTDDKWISHLEPGQSFDTASFSEDGPYINEERLIDPE